MVGAGWRFRRLTPKQISAKICHLWNAQGMWAGRTSSIRPLLSSAEPSSAQLPPPQARQQFLFCVGPGSKQTPYLSVLLALHLAVVEVLDCQDWYIAFTPPCFSTDSFKTVCCYMNQKSFHHCNVLAENEMIYSYNYPGAKGLRQSSLGLFNSLTLVHPKVIEYLSP